MNTEQYMTCVRAYFPGIAFYGNTVYLFPNDLNKHNFNREALCQLCDEFHLPYARRLIRTFWQARPLVIDFYRWLNEDGHADYSYSFTGNTHILRTEAELLRLLKLAHDSDCFHYNKVCP